MAVDRDQALHFATYLQDMAQQAGYNIGLTGGCLYKRGERKDMDFIVYPHEGEYSRADFLLNLDDAGYTITEENEWLVKLSGEFDLDLFFMYKAGGGTGPNVSASTVDHSDEPEAWLGTPSSDRVFETVQQTIESNRQLRRDLETGLNSSGDEAVSVAINLASIDILRRVTGLHGVSTSVSSRSQIVTFILHDGTFHDYTVSDLLIQNERQRQRNRESQLTMPATNRPPWYVNHAGNTL